MGYIETREDLRDFISYESKLYGKKKADIGFMPRLSEKSIIWRYVCLLRYEEYHLNRGHRLRRMYYKYRRIKLGRKCGFLIPTNVIDKGFKIMHIGFICLSAKKIGKNFSCHANVALVAGGHDSSNPVIGDDVVLGYGSTVVGGGNHS